MDPSALLFRILSSLVIFGQSLMGCMAGREECEDRFWPKAYIFFFFKGLDSCEPDFAFLFGGCELELAACAWPGDSS